MIPLISIPEQSFSKLEELRDAIASRNRSIHEVPIHKISLSENGILRAGGFEGHLTEPALYGLLNTEGVPPEFAVKRCPVDLLVTIVGRLAHEQNISIIIQSTNGSATGIIPAGQHPIPYNMIIDHLSIDRPIREATLGTDCLRITAATNNSKELLPDDRFSFGWELITSENGWRPTEVWQWVVREICTNGALGFDKAPLFKRAYNSSEPVLVSLQGLIYTLDNQIQPPLLEPAVRWAAQKEIGAEHALVIDYLARRLEGDATRMELNDIGAGSTWYDLVNTLTSLARLHTVEARRRYEAEGGVLFNWFMRQGRSRPSWRRMSCDECEFSSVGELREQI